VLFAREELSQGPRLRVSLKNAIFDGTDAVMLSGETSKGAYPIQAVRTMRKIAARAEADYSQLTNAEDRFLNLLRKAELVIPSVWQRVREKIEAYHTSPNRKCYMMEYEALEELLETQQTTDRVSHAACNLSIGVHATAIMATTASGQTVRMVARFRPTIPIIRSTS
jgi:pyruvate kinase